MERGVPISGPVSNSERLIESTREAESLGYDAVFIVDHIHNSFERHKQYPVGMGSYQDAANTLDPHQFETVAAFSFLAGATKKIEFGVGVMPLPLREPIVLAKEIATMDALSGGRFIFGVGVSNVSDKEEYRAMGKPFSPYAERYEMIGEYVAAMRAIWERPTASFHGKYVQLRQPDHLSQASAPHTCLGGLLHACRRKAAPGGKIRAGACRRMDVRLSHDTRTREIDDSGFQADGERGRERYSQL